MDLFSDHLLVIVSAAVGAVGALAALVVIGPTRRGVRATDISIATANFRARFHDLRERQVVLGTEALARAQGRWIASDVPLLNAPGWILDEPCRTEHVQLVLARPSSPSGPLIDGRVLRGLSLSGPITYQEAVAQLDPTSEYFNGKVYRLVAVHIAPGPGLSLSFEEAHYFDYLNTSEVLAYEAAMAPKSLGLLRQIGNPFELSQRVASLGILTLTIVKSPDGPQFMMHKRSGRFVVGDGLYHVVPAGEFAPSDVSLRAFEADLDIVRNIFREYAEEFLGMPDAQGNGGHRLDYENSPPYRELYAALDDGTLAIHVLGVGLDPLTLKPEFLTVAVFDSGVFDAIFPQPFPSSVEGVIIDGIPFTRDCVEEYLSNDHTRLGAKGCLSQAWKHYDRLLGTAAQDA